MRSSETGPCSFVNVERNWRLSIPSEAIHSETSSLLLQSFLEVCSLVIQIGCQLCVRQPIGIIHCNKIRKQRRLGQLSKCHPSEHRYANVMWVKSKTISCKESRTAVQTRERCILSLLQGWSTPLSWLPCYLKWILKVSIRHPIPSKDNPVTRPINPCLCHMHRI